MKKEKLENKLSSPNSTSTTKSSSKKLNSNDAMEMDQKLPYLIETIIKDANDSLKNPNFSQKKKELLQQLSLCAYLGLITWLRQGKISQNYGV